VGQACSYLFHRFLLHRKTQISNHLPCILRRLAGGSKIAGNKYRVSRIKSQSLKGTEMELSPSGYPDFSVRIKEANQTQYIKAL
jgi:hypothetical protein